ncbi:MAG: hypothetical protein E6G45_07475, partial [Actinobacteria bacterium]
MARARRSRSSCPSPSYRSRRCWARSRRKPRPQAPADAASWRLVRLSSRVHLRAIKLRGFKSFPDPVEVRLEPGVAVVVGPNGSGKSNISDAL